MTRRTRIAAAPSPVRLSHLYGLCPGLFRPMPRGDAERPRLNIRYRLNTQELAGEALTLHLEAGEALGAGEQTTLLALLAIARDCIRTQANVATLRSDAIDAVGQELWRSLAMQHQGDAAPDTLRFSTTWSAICRASGATPGGDEMRARRDRVRRLCNVSVWEYVDGQAAPRRQSHLLAWVLGDDERVHLALNDRLVQALLGTPYVNVSMSERLSLSTDTARVLHAALSALVRPGRLAEVYLETLCARIWADWNNGNAGQVLKRRRRADVRSALAAIGNLQSWNIARGLDDLMLVRRARLVNNVRETTNPRGIGCAATSDDDRGTVEEELHGNELALPDASRLFTQLA